MLKTWDLAPIAGGRWIGCIESLVTANNSGFNPTSRSGSGLLGTGARGAAATDRGFQASGDDGRHTGLARPSNEIEGKSEHSQGSHSAPFPRALVDFFLKAYSDAGDIVYDPFMGSGTTMAAAHVLGSLLLASN